MIYLLGGGRKGFGDETEEDFKLTLKNKKSIVFIPTTPENKDKCDKYKNINLDWFEELGIRFEEIDIIKLEDTCEECKEKIRNKDVIFLMGGDPISQLKLIKDKKIDIELRKMDAVIIGLSAGALCICDKCIITKDEDYPENIVLDGLNLTNGINVEVHYNNSHDKDILDIMTKFFIDQVYAIPEDCSIKLDKSAIKFLGKEKFYVFKNGGKIEVK